MAALYRSRTATVDLLCRSSLAVLILSVIGCAGAHASAHPVTVEDCVGLTKIADGPVVSRDGALFAFITEKADTGSDANVFEVRVASPTQAGDQNGRLVFSSRKELSSLHWLQNGERLSVLVGHNRTIRKPSEIVILDLSRPGQMVSLKEPRGITDYSISDDGRTVAYFSPVRPSPDSLRLLNSVQRSHGVLIDDQFPTALAWNRGAVLAGPMSLWLSRRARERSKWKTTEVPAPFDASDGTLISQFRLAQGVSLSPDGNYLAFQYMRLRNYERWSSSRTVRSFEEDFNVLPHTLALFDVKHHKLVDGPEFPFPNPYKIWWSDDSASFAVYSVAPLGSRWEKQDADADTLPRGAAMYHVFSEKIATGVVSEVLKPDEIKGDMYVMAWKHADSDFLIHTGERGKAFLDLTLRDGIWQVSNEQNGEVTFPLRNFASRDGVHILGIHEDSQHPPDIWYADLKTSREPVQLTTLNPGVRALSLGRVEDLAWKNKYDFLVHGKVVLPPDYSPLIRYPLIIMLTWPDYDFVCDCAYTTAFAPQPLANAGFVVVMFDVYDAFSSKGPHPSGPPQTKEAEATVASVEALVDTLAESQMIDKNNVGIIGFSRSSWKVDYLLTHSDLNIQAASSADGGLGEYGVLWLGDGEDMAKGVSKSYGGGFEGAARSSWLAGSPAFNAEKVSAPLLMEYTGNHGLLDQPLSAYEFHAALKSLGKPVELFFYPDGYHPLDTPSERMASLRRNVDWFRFWQQGYEGTPPSYDPQQYQRWRNLKHAMMHTGLRTLSSE